MATEKKETKKSESAPKPRASAAPKAPKAPAPAVTSAPSTAIVDSRDPLQKRGTVVGTVVSNKMQKTIVVKVDRHVRHAFYKKYLVRSERYKAHDETNDAKMGDQVVLVESRPLSRHKRWVLQSILRRAGQAEHINV
jgi:small subunit ribosomal protein S17